MAGRFFDEQANVRYREDDDDFNGVARRRNAYYPKYGKRHVLSFWLFTGFINLYILRVCINVAIIFMVNSDQPNANYGASIGDTCPVDSAADSRNATSPLRTGEFNWDHETQGIVLSGFYYGYICTQLVGGYLARLTGATFLFGMGIGGTAALTLLSPIAARTGPGYLTALRVMEGFLEGFTMPSSHCLLGNWAPNKERSLLVAFPFSGQSIGTILAAVSTGLLCEYGFDGGWPSSFYVFGLIGVLWSFGWFYYISDTPDKHPTISADERAYIEENCQSSSRPVAFSDVPWRKIATSPAVWAIVIAHTACNWNYYTLLTEIPTYLKDVLHITSSANGVVMSLPYVFIFLVQVVAAYLADVLREKGIATRNVRKLYYCGGMVLSAIFLVAISYVNCNVAGAITFLCLAVGISGFGFSGYIVNHVDIAPQYASILMGVTNTFATVPGIVSPVLAGAITNQESSVATWRSVFFISAVISVIGAAAFGALADGEVQPWARVAVAADRPDEERRSSRSIGATDPLLEHEL